MHQAAYSPTFYLSFADRDRITCFNDDIQSTSAITLAGLLASMKARGLDPAALANERIVCVGAGSAGIG